MKKRRIIKNIIILILVTVSVLASNKKHHKTYVKPNYEKKIIWNEIERGLFYTEINAPIKSKVNDSKISVLRIDPKFYSFELLTATEHDSLRRTAEQWSNDFNLVAVINAGMFNLSDHFTGTGYLKNFSHVNNGKIRENFRAMAMFNPKSSKYPAMSIVDMELENWQTILENYNSAFQCIRMIDCNQKKVLWKPRRPISSSMCVLGTDKKGNILFVFCRSPYTANTMSDFILGLPLNVYSVMYLEGGPESSLFVNAGDTIIEKVGSWVSPGYANDDNNYFWELPNVIGVKRKSNYPL